MLDVYLSSTSSYLNEVICVLTVLASLFIPPTFIVDLYGMNSERGSPVAQVIPDDVIYTALPCRSPVIPGTYDLFLPRSKIAL